MGPWGNRDGGGEAVRVQQRRRIGRAGAGQVAGASATSAASGGVAGRAWRMREQGTPDP